MPRKPKDQTKFYNMIPNPCGGRPRKFDTPQQLWNRALEYFKWEDSHPWELKAATNSMTQSDGGMSTAAERGRRNNSVSQNVRVIQVPYTVYHLQAFLGISKWADFKRNYAEREGFLEVINAIDSIITGQQVKGAMIHQFDSNLVARLNGIAEVTKTEITGKDGESLFHGLPKLSKEDLEQIAAINDGL